MTEFSRLEDAVLSPPIQPVVMRPSSSAEPVSGQTDAYAVRVKLVAGDATLLNGMCIEFPGKTYYEEKKSTKFHAG